MKFVKIQTVGTATTLSRLKKMLQFKIKLRLKFSYLGSLGSHFPLSPRPNYSLMSAGRQRKLRINLG